MTEAQLREIIRIEWMDRIPDEVQIEAWAVATGLNAEDIRLLYAEMIEHPHPGGTHAGIFDGGD